MQRTLKALGYGIFAAFLIFAPVKAVTEPAITISPFLRDVRIGADEPTKDFIVEISNSSSEELTLGLSVLDFGSLDESGGVVFAGSSSSSLIKKYGLADWLQLNTSTLVLPPNQSAEVVATIINDISLSPGGHYAAIIATVDSPLGGEGNKINIDQKLSALILATKVGGEKYDLKLNGVQHNGSWLKLPKEVILEFGNPGNVHVVPRGTVKLIGPGGRVISQGAINEESGFVLPETKRQMKVDLKGVNSSNWLPGMYHLQIDYRYDGLDQYARRNQNLYFVNLPGLVFISFLVITSIALTVFIKRKNRSKVPSKNDKQ